MWVWVQPDILAPGSNILAAYPKTRLDQENGYGIASGTSMAAPHISGIVLLLKAIHPDWSPAAIKSALITTGIYLYNYLFKLIFA